MVLRGPARRLLVVACVYSMRIAREMSASRLVGNLVLLVISSCNAGVSPSKRWSRRWRSVYGSRSRSSDSTYPANSKTDCPRCLFWRASRCRRATSNCRIAIGATLFCSSSLNPSYVVILLSDSFARSHASAALCFRNDFAKVMRRSSD